MDAIQKGLKHIDWSITATLQNRETQKLEAEKKKQNPRYAKTPACRAEYQPLNRSSSQLTYLKKKKKQFGRLHREKTRHNQRSRPISTVSTHKPFALGERRGPIGEADRPVVFHRTNLDERRSQHSLDVIGLETSVLGLRRLSQVFDYLVRGRSAQVSLQQRLHDATAVE